MAALAGGTTLVPRRQPARARALAPAQQCAPPPRAAGPSLTSSSLARDPGFARVQRAALRSRDSGRVPAALAQYGDGEERYDQPAEQYNELGTPIEAFNLRRERQVPTTPVRGVVVQCDACCLVG